MLRFYINSFNTVFQDREQNYVQEALFGLIYIIAILLFNLHYLTILKVTQ